MQIKSKKNLKKSITGYINRRLNSAIVTNVEQDAAALPLLRTAVQCRKENSSAVIVCAVPELAAAERLNGELAVLINELGLKFTSTLLPETIRGKLVITGGESERAKVLSDMLKNPPDLLIASVHALTSPAPPPEKIRNSEFTLHTGMEISMTDLLTKLVAMDYDDELEVTVCGEFSRRGGILDIYSPAHEYPCRIEFFGDEIESMRQFQPETQRSTGTVDSYRIITPHPSADAEKEPETSCDFFDYLPADKMYLAVLCPENCRSRLERFSGSEFTERFDEICRSAEARQMLCRLTDATESATVDGGEPAECYPPLAHLAASLPPELRYGALELMRDMLLTQISQWLESSYSITLTAAASGGMEHLKNWIENNKLADSGINIVQSAITGGFMLPAEKEVVLTERELFTVNAFSRPSVISSKDKPQTVTEKSAELGENSILSDLDEGDYAVHLDHGIARFHGISNAESRGIRREVMKLEYRDGVLLNVPLIQAHLVSRYLGAAGKVVLHKIGSNTWNRDKAAAGRSVRAYAADMLRLQAVRAASPGIPFPPDDLESRLFEGSFPYTDTPDQTRSTAEIKQDMERSRPMDRLLCGDVGYGKTELAMRAAFKAAAAGYQVAVLAPTTVLVQQHYHTFRERFAEHPFNIDMLSRFRTAAEQAEIMEKLKTGGIDIVIGTHRLCSGNVSFRNLGLIIIDEEQRFGVRHKELLRRMRTEVDVLTMSATPIPRTLYLAMAGARDLSTLQTAPRARLPVKTIVAPEDMELITGAIRSEMERGGQVYYLHNRVRTIEECRDKLAAAMPGVRFAVAHGQMSEGELGRIMTDFMSRRIDCLVCSTIIESGLDIPNANTIIIERADRFGLAELYQLRGRVGRRTHQAYAYMLLPHNMLLTSDARKRIAAIRRCSELGAGFQLALRDLEIRGSGNILGEEQSGHLNAIGFELYCRLLKNEVANLRGERPVFVPEAEIAIDFVTYGYEAPEGILPMAFPPEYIDGVRPRIAAYRRLGSLTGENDVEEFRKELIDRYGKLPESAENLLKITTLKIMTALAGYTSLSVGEGRVQLLKAGGNIYREEGKVPYIDYRNPPQLRLAILKEILRRANRNQEIDT